MAICVDFGTDKYNMPSLCPPGIGMGGVCIPNFPGG
jgi:hypothetical protein